MNVVFLGLRRLATIDFILGLAGGECGLHVHLNLAHLALGGSLERLEFVVGYDLEFIDIHLHRADGGVSRAIERDFARGLQDSVGFGLSRLSRHIDRKFPGAGIGRERGSRRGLGGDLRLFHELLNFGRNIENALGQLDVKVYLLYDDLILLAGRALGGLVRSQNVAVLAVVVVQDFNRDVAHRSAARAVRFDQQPRLLVVKLGGRVAGSGSQYDFIAVVALDGLRASGFDLAVELLHNQRQIERRITKALCEFYALLYAWSLERVVFPRHLAVAALLDLTDSRDFHHQAILIGLSLINRERAFQPGRGNFEVAVRHLVVALLQRRAAASGLQVFDENCVRGRKAVCGKKNERTKKKGERKLRHGVPPSPFYHCTAADQDRAGSSLASATNWTKTYPPSAPLRHGPFRAVPWTQAAIQRPSRLRDRSGTKPCPILPC